MQILSMMALFPLFRRFLNTVQVFYTAVGMAVAGYASLLAMAFGTTMTNVYLLFIPAFFIFSANGVLTVLTTVFLANTVDYGELKNCRRDESVIFSMQTFVVKLASGISALAAALCLQVFHFSRDTDSAAAAVSASSITGLRMTMTLLPVAGLAVAVVLFRRRFLLNEEKMDQITKELAERS